MRACERGKMLNVLTWRIRHDATLRHQIRLLTCTSSALLSHIASDASLSNYVLMHAMHSAARPVYHVHVKLRMRPHCICSTQPGVVCLACCLRIVPLVLTILKGHALTLPLRRLVQCFCSTGFVLNFVGFS